MSFFKYFLFIMFLLSEAVYANIDFAVIVSKNSSIKTISKKSVSNIFLAKTKRLPNGKKAITLGLKKSNFEEQFLKKVTGKSAKQLKRYWATVIFTGKGQPPKKMKNIQAIIEFVENNPHAIAYIPLKDAQVDKIKIVMEVR